MKTPSALMMSVAFALMVPASPAVASDLYDEVRGKVRLAVQRAFDSEHSQINTLGSCVAQAAKDASEMFERDSTRMRPWISGKVNVCFNGKVDKAWEDFEKAWDDKDQAKDKVNDYFDDALLNLERKFALSAHKKAFALTTVDVLRDKLIDEVNDNFQSASCSDKAELKKEAVKIFSLNNSDFLKERNSPNRSACFNWTAEGLNSQTDCSIPTGVAYLPGVKELITSWAPTFDKACTQHDFGYVNFGNYGDDWKDLDSTDSRRLEVDKHWLRQMKARCDSSGTPNLCKTAADQYYNAVRAGGGKYFK